MAKKPKVETKRGLTPVGMASFPNLFEPKKINEADPKEEPKFRLTHVYKPKDFDTTNKAEFDLMIENVNHVCREELHKTFVDGEQTDKDKQPLTGMVEAFEAALVEHAKTPLKAHFLAFKCLQWYDKKDDIMRSCRSPFLLGAKDDYVDDDAIFIRMSSRADRPPDVVDQGKDPIVEKDIYGGVIVRTSYTAYPYNNLGNIGVTLYLGNVQRVGAGKRIGGGPSAAEEFDEIPADDVPF